MCWICRRTVYIVSLRTRAVVDKSANVSCTVIFFFFDALCCVQKRSPQLTRQAEQNQPVDHQDGPENRQVENLKPAAQKSNGNGLGGAVPELELWEPPHKGPELVFFFCGESRRAAFLHALILFERWVEFGRDEGEEQVQEVDTERVCDWTVVSCLLPCDAKFAGPRRPAEHRDREGK